MKIDAFRLRGFLDCMHDEADERDKRSAQIRAIVKAAKEVGYDTKAMRKVFTRERMDEAERGKQDDLLEAYEHALGGKGRALRAIEAGAPVGEACAANGVHRATVARARDVAKQASNATTPHDSETGEIIESTAPKANNDGLPDHDSVSESTTEKAAPLVQAPCRPQPVSNEQSGGRTGTHSVEGGVANLVRDGGASAGITTASASPSPSKPDLYQRLTGAFNPLQDDDLAIPAHLKRERVGA